MKLAALGLGLAVVSGLAGWLAGRPFLTAVWSDLPLPAAGKAGTPLLFDAGVYLVVLGIGTAVLLELMAEAD